MLLLRPFIIICLAQVAVTAPAPIPGPIPLADHADLGQLFHGISKFVKRLVGIAPRAEVNNYGAYGSYGKYGSYGNYPDVDGEVNSETSSEANSEAEAESLTTLTTTMPVFTTTITLRSVSTSTSTPLPTITAVSTASRLWQMSIRAWHRGHQPLAGSHDPVANLWSSFVL